MDRKLDCTLLTPSWETTVIQHKKQHRQQLQRHTNLSMYVDDVCVYVHPVHLDSVLKRMSHNQHFNRLKYSSRHVRALWKQLQPLIEPLHWMMALYPITHVGCCGIFLSKHKYFDFAFAVNFPPVNAAVILDKDDKEFSYQLHQHGEKQSHFMTPTSLKEP